MLDIRLQLENPFIPRNAALRFSPRTGEFDTIPELIYRGPNDSVLLWVAKDKQFGDSKTVLFLRLFHSSPRRTASDVAKQAVYNRLIYNIRSLKLGHANAAGLHWSCMDLNYWIEIQVSGFTENTFNLLKEVCSAAKDLEINNAKFTQVRSMVVQSYQNASKFPATHRRLEMLLPAFSDEIY